MKKIVVIGGGFFGMYLSEYMAKKGCQVTLLEKSDNVMSRASFNNQARVHNGYHYPRSILTALRSRISFPRFVNEFKNCIFDDFDKYYLVGAKLSKVTALQFYQFCNRIGAHCEPAPSKFSRLVQSHLVEACFSVKEFAFDSYKLSQAMLERLVDCKIDIRLNSLAEKISSIPDGLELLYTDLKKGSRDYLFADHVFNCTYSSINYICAASSLELIPLKHEFTEMCLVDVPDELKKVGITVMCGPFFSIMPFPSSNLHSFSHVRYTPHYEWIEHTNLPYDQNRHTIPQHPQSAWRYMLKDTVRYIPILNECNYQRSLWEFKTVLPHSETDDSRPILFKMNHGIPGFHCVMGGKIDNIYDVLNVIDQAGLI